VKGQGGKKEGKGCSAPHGVSQQVFKVTTSCMDTCFQSLSPLIDNPPCTAEIQRMSQQATATTHVYSRLALGIHISASCPRCINQPGLGHDCWLGKSGLVGCLTVQKLDCVRSAMCLRTVLVEDKHIMIKLQCDSCISFYFEVT